jgi:hypothetical protein
MSLKLKKCKNKEICFRVLKSNERGLFRKPLESMANKSRSLTNYEVHGCISHASTEHQGKYCTTQGLF